jgi:Arc/MetJ-type ribon-helix-helix transcriptional regulator
MNIDQLSPEALAWLKARVQQGHFASWEEAIDYSVKLTSLREGLYAAIADPRRYSAAEMRAGLRAHLDQRARETKFMSNRS